MTPPTKPAQVTLVFPSLENISLYKHECQCNDFYVQREDKILVGSFTPEQVVVAVEKYAARLVDA